MPLIDLSDGQPSQPIDTLPQIAKPEFRGVSIDTELVPEIALITHIQGSPYTVTYFSQVITEDSGLSGAGSGLSGVHQQYRKINDMVLMVTSELSYSQDAETKDTSYTGTAVVYPFIIPNEGDHFSGNLGNGRLGIFEITSTRRLSVYKQTCHEVDFKLVRDASSNALQELEQKTIQTLYYDKSFLDHGKNPLLFEEEYNVVQRLRKKYTELVRNYIRMFFSCEFATILVGGQDQTTYDDKLTRFILHLLSVSEAPEVAHIRTMNLDGDQAASAWCLWDALMRREDIVRSCFRKVGTVDSLSFSMDPTLGSIRYSGIEKVVYPIDMQINVDSVHSYRPKSVSGFLQSNDHAMFMDSGELRISSLDDINFIIDPQPLPAFYNTPVVHPTAIPLYHPIAPQGFYVLSGYFYRNKQADVFQQSQLEVQLYNFINNRQIDIGVVDRLVGSIENMTPLEQTYLVPLILLLIRQRIFITV